MRHALPKVKSELWIEGSAFIESLLAVGSVMGGPGRNPPSGQHKLQPNEQGTPPQGALFI